MNAIIYIRVSTTEQAQLGYSLKAQEEICLNYARKNNYNVLKVFTEKGESAKTTDRTELNNLLDYVKNNKNKIDFLIVYKIDRLSRDVYDTLSLKIHLNKLGVELKSVSEPLDNSPIGKFTTHLFSSLAQLDNDMRAERTIMGMKQAVKEGRWMWQPPYGYKLENLNGKSYLTINDEQANIIREIFNLYDIGYRGSKLTDKIKQKGFKLSKQTLSKILKNVAYKGMIKVENWFGKEEIIGLHEPIIYEELFNRIQFKLGVYKNFQKSKTIPNEDFPLRGILYCSICGKKLTGAFSTGRNKKYPYYRCSTNNCTYRSKSKYEIEDSFRNYLKELTPKENLLDDFTDSMKIVWNEKTENRNDYFKKIKNNLNVTDIKIDNLIKLYEKNLISEEDFSIRYSNLKNYQQELNISVQEQEVTLNNLNDYIEYGIYVLKDLPNFWDNSDIGIKNKLCSILFPEGIYYSDNNIGTTNLSTVLGVFSPKNYEKSIMVSEGGLEPPRTIAFTRPSTLRVYQFRHSDKLREN